jgi:hypothetical protein
MRIRVLQILLVFFLSCVSGAIPDPVNDFANHKPLLDRPLHERLTSDPLILNYLKKFDSSPDYSFYEPGAADMKIIRDAFAALPPACAFVLHERLIGYCFINDFQSSGLTEWIKAADGRFYYFIAFNPGILKKTLNQILNSKEQTCFLRDKSGVSINLECGSGGSGFLYVLVHESIHAVDYTYRITPYTENSFRKAAGLSGSPTVFTEGIWKEPAVPVENFRLREKITFYNLNGGPKLSLAEAPAVYAELARSPFVTLYGTLNWAEDLAEYMTFYHLVRKMNMPFTITVRNSEGTAAVYEPFKNSRITAREKNADFFYSSFKK